MNNLGLLLITVLAHKLLRIKLIHLLNFVLGPFTISLSVHRLTINFCVITSIFHNTFAAEIILLIKHGFDFLWAHRDRILKLLFLIKWRHLNVLPIVSLRLPLLSGVFLVCMFIDIPTLIWRWQHWIIYLGLRWKLALVCSLR